MEPSAKSISVAARAPASHEVPDRGRFDGSAIESVSPTRIVHRDVLQNVYGFINEKFGSDEKAPE